MNVIHHRVYYLRHDVSESGFCLLLQVEPTRLGPIDRASPCNQSGTEKETSSIYWTKLRSFYLKTPTESGRCVLNKRQDKEICPES
jgi:hypothetical protein